MEVHKSVKNTIQYWKHNEKQKHKIVKTLKIDFILQLFSKIGQ